MCTYRNTSTDVWCPFLPFLPLSLFLPFPPSFLLLLSFWSDLGGVSMYATNVVMKRHYKAWLFGGAAFGHQRPEECCWTALPMRSRTRAPLL